MDQLANNHVSVPKSQTLNLPTCESELKKIKAIPANLRREYEEAIQQLEKDNQVTIDRMQKEINRAKSDETTGYRVDRVLWNLLIKDIKPKL